MEITGKVLREVEFRDRLRGYDFEEVDEFLEQVAVAVDAMQAELASLRKSLELADDRIAKAEALVEELKSQGSSGESRPIDDEGIKKTLMLAQRTADMAIAEAKAEADKLLSAARTEAEKVLSEADEYVKNMKTEAEKGLSARIESLTKDHDQLVAEIKVLNQVLKAERTRLTEALKSALRFVEQSFPTNDTVVDIAENGNSALSSMAISSSDNMPSANENSFSNVESFNVKEAHAGNKTNKTSDNTDQSESNAMDHTNREIQHITEQENNFTASQQEYEALYDDHVNEVDLTVISSADESQEFSNSSAAPQYATTSQRDDGIVDSLLQDMFESLGQDNDDEIMWARFTSSSMDVNVAKSDKPISIAPGASSSSEMKEQVVEGDVQGEVLQFERNKKQNNN